MSNALEKRRALFKLYSANLALYQPQNAGLFKCPICGELFYEDAIEAASLKVDLAHVYPASCSGNLATLTCSPCNSRIGSKFDSHLAKERVLHDAFGGAGNVAVDARAVFDLGGSTSADIGVRIVRRGEIMELEAIAPQSNPTQTKKIEQHLRAGVDELKFKVSWKGFDVKRQSVAILHAAYLSLFRQYGYEYPFRAETQWVRDILLRDDPPDKIPVPIVTVPAGSIAIPKSRGANELLFSVGIARMEDSGLMCMMVMLPSPAAAHDARVVLMPGFGTHGKDAYDKVSAISSGKRQLTFKIEDSVPEDRLAKPEWRFLGSRLWDYWKDVGAQE